MTGAVRRGGNSPPKKQFLGMVCEKRISNPLPVSPYSPKILMKTSASVPAPMTSPVYTLISYLLPENEDRESLGSLGSQGEKNRDPKVTTTLSTLPSISA